ncbi:hypothetical protein [Nonomuraea pusilla]|uniref:Uncharacterized protein n=1 Tax=Nonomuraea pusilla TaxID=46177 RepID=A0A1H7M5H9_9ACTN|nr:hypothetical protein [Nonomuraea pusilla]SEL06473.1 hypothetical protein SAMN05660976_01772 [Nonomuraea pusilla]
MIKMLHKMGIKSNHMYIAGIASIGLSVASWVASRNLETRGIDRADRWGIFVGQWAPTLFCMGVALKLEETHPEPEEPGMEMFEGTRERATTRAGV